MNSVDPALFERYALPKPKEVSKRPPWRPITRTPEHYAALIQQHQQIAQWFFSSFGRPHSSDRELIKAYLADQYVQAGMRASRANFNGVSGSLKTILNELSRARQLFPESRKGALRGKATVRLIECKEDF